MNAALWIFLQACVCGAVSGMLYSLLRLVCGMFSLGKRFVFWLDGLFFLCVSVGIFHFDLRLLNGQLRFFVLMGWLLGGVLCRFTAGEFCIACIRPARLFLLIPGKTLRYFRLKKSRSLGQNE